MPTATPPLPVQCFESHVGVVGKTGSGKTSTVKSIVEYLVAIGERVCIVDPIKSDYFGLTSSADGKSPGLPFQILGGPHGHVPLHAAAGKAVGELVATGALRLSILDMADFGPGDHSKFFVDFAQAIMRKSRGVVYLVLEEAHIFAPKIRAGFDHETLSMHYTNKLATASRSKGVRFIVSTQRTQKLHNDVLSSCETIVAHRITFPADQKPVLEWLTAKCDKAMANTVYDSLSSLKTGEGWICSGELNLLERTHFPKFSTYDNSRTPETEDGEHHVRTAEVDRDALRSLIGEAVAEAEANDPKALRERVRELEEQLRDAPSAVRDAPAGQVFTEAEYQIEIAGLESRINSMREQIDLLINQRANYQIGIERKIDTAVTYIKRICDELITDANALAQSLTTNFVPDVPAPSPVLGEVVAATGDPPKADVTRVSPSRTYAPAAVAVAELRPAYNAATNGHAKTEGVSGGMQKILDALAWWSSIGERQPCREAVATVAGYTASAGGFRNYLGHLRTLGLIDYPSQGHVAAAAILFPKGLH